MSEQQQNNAQNPSPFVAVAVLLLFLVGGAVAFFAFGEKTIPRDTISRGTFTTKTAITPTVNFAVQNQLVSKSLETLNYHLKT